MSVRASTGSRRACSGLMYPTLPNTMPGTVCATRIDDVASPKSANRTAPAQSTKMFDGVTSRCTSASPGAVWA